jgi:Glycosyl transferase family 11
VRGDKGSFLENLKNKKVKEMKIDLHTPLKLNNDTNVPKFLLARESNLTDWFSVMVRRIYHLVAHRVWINTERVKKQLNQLHAVNELEVSKINALFQGTVLENYVLNVYGKSAPTLLSIGSDFGVSLSMSSGKKRSNLQDYVKSEVPLKHLSAATGHKVTAHTDLNNLIGPAYLRWATQSGMKEEEIIEGHQVRLKALEKDLQELGIWAKVLNQIDYDHLFTIDGKKAIVVSLYDGMGNQMFQAASGYAMAKDIGVDFYCVQKRGVEHQRSMPEVLKKLPYKTADSLPLLPYMNANSWDKHVLTDYPKEPRSWLVEGILQSPLNFDHHREEIVKLFGPSPEAKEKMRAKYPDINKPKTVAVHVRRGDYLNKDDKGNYFVHNLLDDWNYYEQALTQIGTDDAHVFIFSNDIPYCRSHKAFKNLKNVTFVEGGSASDDMYLMSLCNNFVISNGTFAWWGAYLCEDKDRRVLYPNKWLGPAWGNFLPSGLPHKSWSMIQCAKK